MKAKECFTGFTSSVPHFDPVIVSHVSSDESVLQNAVNFFNESVTSDPQSHKACPAFFSSAPRRYASSFVVIVSVAVFTSAKEVMFLPVFVCLFVCESAR